MEWTIPFQPPEWTEEISIRDQVYAAGSCFAHSWSEELLQLGWPVSYHPLHITFHPAALLKQLKLCFQLEELSQEHWKKADGLWHHFDFHSLFSGNTHSEAKKRIREHLGVTQASLKKADWVVITLGTAITQRLKKTNQIVANCHKVPKEEFQSQLSTIADLEKTFTEIQSLLENRAEVTQVVWTVSPVRHLRSGLVNNQRSKAHLISALHQFLRDQNHAHYFPAYEWMMDVLRDYRFYAEDRVHPSKEAQRFIFEKFVDHAFSDEARKLFQELKKFRKMKDHQTRFPHSTSAKAFEKEKKARKEKLLEKHPFLHL